MSRDVLLINPAPLFNPAFKKPSAEKYPYPPLGLLCLAGPLLMHGYRVTILDFFREEFTSKAAFRERLSSLGLNPMLVGISTYTSTTGDAERISRAVREIYPEAPIVLGGAHATFCDLDLLADCPQIDYIIRGEGEATLVELLEALQHPRALPLSSIRGLTYRDSDHHGVRTASRPYLTHLDCLPLPPYHLLPASATIWGYNILALLTSRGCPGTCIFCASRAFSGGTYRMHSAEWLISVVYLNHREPGFSTMNVLDDTFVADAERLERFCAYLDSLHLKLAWSCKSRVDALTPEVLRLLARAGCKSIHIGVESADDRVLRSIAKGITVRSIFEAIIALRSHGIRADCSFIIGNHSDTKASMEKTLLLAARLVSENLGSASVGICTPFPGTPLRRRAEQLGLRIESRNWKHYDLHTATCRTEHLTPEDVQRAQFRFDIGSIGSDGEVDSPEVRAFQRELDDFVARARRAEEGKPC
jgi:radical SAM superfamily enzyme YgiQ (UPF0313 family)